MTGTEYGTALYSLAKEENRSEEIKAELCEISEAIKNNPEFISFADCSGISLEERLSVIDGCFGGTNEYVLNVIKLLTEKRGMHCFSQCVKAYCEQFDRDSGTEYVDAITAVPMSEDAIGRLSKALEGKYGKKYIVKNIIDKTVLGGVVLQFSDARMDASVLGKLQDAERQLKTITI